MDKLLVSCFWILMSGVIFAQASGNINYQNQTRYPDQNININLSGNADLLISVKGMANIKADNYVAIFNITQVGKSTDEVNSLLTERVAVVEKALSGKQGVETFVDMVSFVPVYEFEVEKKIFSKKTYNEIPNGFELKKNIHIKYKDANLLNEIITICTSAEIYDLVRVDYFSDELEQVKRDLRVKSQVILKEKVANYQLILGTDLSKNEKQIADGYKIVYPVEMYRSYQAYSSSSLNLKKSAKVNQVEKSTNLYYQPIMDKEFDFIVNPTILEPVIQVMYEVKFKINRKMQAVKDDVAKKEYLLITPNGDVRNLNITN